MFKVNNIVKKNKEINRNRSFINNVIQTEKDHLPEEERKELEGAVSEIRDLSHQIGRDTGWKYTGSGFVFNSNFIYNAESEQIDFIENEVEFTDGTLKPKHNTKRELDFLNKNREALKNFEVAMRKRDYYEGLAYACMTSDIESGKTDMSAVTVVDTSTSRLVLEEEEMVNTEYMANRFYNEFGNDGIVLLIKWLNRMANADKPSDVFPEILDEDVDDEMKGQILYWAGEYNYAGRFLEAEYLKRPKKEKKKEEGHQKIHE